MQLSFENPYLSISSFPTVDLPPFTLVTGVNGAGKTHLLGAILQGNVKTDITQDIQKDIRFFDWNSLAPHDTGIFTVTQLYEQRDQILEQVQQYREQYHQNVQNWISKYNPRTQEKVAIWELLRLNEADLHQLISDPSERETARQEIQNLSQNVLQTITQNFRNNRNNPKNQSIIEKLSAIHRDFVGGLLALELSDFEGTHFDWGQSDMFQQSFAQLFTSYHELKKQNALRQLDEQRGIAPRPASLSDEEFVNRYGKPPWVFVNRTLADAGLDFEISFPVEYTITGFTPQLRKRSSGIDMQFSSLSSGERILMSFAFCLYYSQDDRQVVQRPKLLLFDEIDATLHPSMSRQLIETIQRSLVAEQGIKVMLCTHSPSTVAVAPEESVYVMHPGKPGLHKVNKRQAIATLSYEVPTLSIDFSGRRQVFVESTYDAERYEKLYRYLSPHIASERSLAFIAAGHRNKQREDDGGCDSVKRIVGALVESGNESIFGLIDWDTTNDDEEHLVVLAKNKRYAIENCLLDPLLVAALIIRTDHTWAREQGISDIAYFDFRSLAEEKRQELVDSIERKVFGLGSNIPFGNRITTRYVDGTSAQVSEDYLTMRGHDLEERVKGSFPILKRYHNQGDLLMAIIDPVIYELNGLAPVEILQAFEKILDWAPDGSP